MVGLAPSFDAVGWLTRDSGTLRRVAGVLTPDTRLRARPELVTLRELAAIPGDALRASFVDVCHRLDASEVGVDADIEAWFAAFRTVQAYEAWQLHGPWIVTHPDALGDAPSLGMNTARVSPIVNSPRADVGAFTRRA